MELINTYFPELSKSQILKFEKLFDIYAELNLRVNLISRKDFPHFYERHVLHSLSIAKVISFPKNSLVLDVGTGGGFPLIPLSIYFTNVKFVGIDSIKKKIDAVQFVIDKLTIDNTKVYQFRSTDFKGSYDYIVFRAVSDMFTFVKNTHHLLKTNGLYVGLKGGDLADELAPFPKAKIVDVFSFFPRPFFETKKVVLLSKI